MRTTKDLNSKEQGTGRPKALSARSRELLHAREIVMVSTTTIGPNAPMKSLRNFSGLQPELVFGKKLRPTFSFEGKLNCLEKKQKNLTIFYFVRL